MAAILQALIEKCKNTQVFNQINKTKTKMSINALENKFAGSDIFVSSIILSICSILLDRRIAINAPQNRAFYLKMHQETVEKHIQIKFQSEFLKEI